MKSNYKANMQRLGDNIHFVNMRNTEARDLPLKGININKEFIPSVANIIGTDMSKYKIVTKGCFACNLMHVGRDQCLPVSYYTNETDILVSPAYSVFAVNGDSMLIPEYLMLCFANKQFDHIAWFNSMSGIRGNLEWDELCNIKIPVPSIEEQRKIVETYQAIERRCNLLKKINDNLEAQAQAVFKSWFIDFDNFEMDEVTQLPLGWHKGTLSEIILSTIGGDWGKEKSQGNYSQKVSVIRGTDIPSLSKGVDSNLPTRYILPNNFPSRKIGDNSLVVEISGGSPVQSTGRIAIISNYLLSKYNNYLVCSNFCRMLSVAKRDRAFVFCMWRYLYKLDVMFSYENSSTGVKNFNIQDFLAKEEITVPPPSVRERFSEVFTCIFSQIEFNGAEITKLEILMSNLLSRMLLQKMQ